MADLTEKQKAFADEKPDIATPKEIIETLIELFYHPEVNDSEKEIIAYSLARADIETNNSKLANKLNKDMVPYAKNYMKKKQQYKIDAHNRREDKRNGLTLEEWEDTLYYFYNSCAYCGQKSSLAMDHFIPFSNGGELTARNTIPACKRCNSSKHDNEFEGWYKKQEYYSEAREKKIKMFLNKR